MSDQTNDEKKIGFRTPKGAPLRVVIDGAYLRNQAHEAMLTFIAPLNGVYAAATGVRPSEVANESPKQNKDA